MNSTTEMAIRTSSTPELVAAAVTGDRDAWTGLEARYHPVIDSRIAGFRLQAADAADVRQSVWLRLLEQATRLHTPEHLGGWLATVTTRECLLLLRRRRRGPVLDGDGIADVAADLPDPDAALVAAEERAAVRRAVGTLSARRQALAVALFREARRPYADVAREVGLPVGSIGPTRARLLTDLRREWARRT
jgi:RNA polymerase sigma factor (sigma-70 family)